MAEGKPTHATGVLEGTRIVPNHYGTTKYLCPCGTTFYSLAHIRKHVAGKYKRQENNCPKTR